MKLFIVLALLIASAAAAPQYFRDTDGFIVGGQDADIDQFPFILSLRVNGNHNCGGSIINDRWVLSAAHCWPATAVPTPYSVRVGSHFRSSGGSIHQANFIQRHPQYTPATINNDVGLIGVVEPFVFGPTVASISLVASGVDPAGGTDVYIAGWGTLAWQGSAPERLQYAHVEIVARATCQAQYGGTSITEQMICAALPGRDACQGDSGGPLTNQARTVQYGVVSWGHQCAHPNFAGVYAHVGYPTINSWITATAA